MPQDNQHWVPKFLIKNFADIDGRVFCFNIRPSEVTKPPPKHASAEIGFNEFSLDGETVSFEDQLEKIETKAAPILSQIVASRNLMALGQKDVNASPNS
jgi:hypothetical protein